MSRVPFLTGDAPVLPPDDPSRDVVIARPDTDPDLPHVAVVGDVYTILSCPVCCSLR